MQRHPLSTADSDPSRTRLNAAEEKLKNASQHDAEEVQRANVATDNSRGWRHQNGNFTRHALLEVTVLSWQPRWGASS